MQRLSDQFSPAFRMALGGIAVVSWYNAVHDPFSSLFTIGQRDHGLTLLWLMGMFGALIVIDVLLNDWSPKCVRLRHKRIYIRWVRAFKHRHWLFVGLALCYAAQPFVASRGGYAVSLLPYFYWYALCNLGCAFLDASQRSRSAGWQNSYN